MHAEALPTDWLDLAREMRALAERPDTTPGRREMYLRTTMHYEVAAVIQALILAAGRLAEHRRASTRGVAGHGRRLATHGRRGADDRQRIRCSGTGRCGSPIADTAWAS